jgi:hypothetical protein
MYPASTRLNKIDDQATQLVLIDEIHLLAGDRGPVLSEVIALCLEHEIPILLLTGTIHQAIPVSFRDTFPLLIQISSGPVIDYSQIPVRFDDEVAMIDMSTYSATRKYVRSRKNNGRLCFVLTVNELYP